MLEEKCEEQRQLIEQQRQLIIRLGSEAAGSVLHKADHAQVRQPAHNRCCIRWRSVQPREGLMPSSVLQLAFSLGSNAMALYLFSIQAVAHPQEDELSSPPSRLECPVCWHSTKQVAFGCGHLTCEKCSLLVDCCPVCRWGPAEARTWLTGCWHALLLALGVQPYQQVARSGAVLQLCGRHQSQPSRSHAVRSAAGHAAPALNWSIRSSAACSSGGSHSLPGLPEPVMACTADGLQPYGHAPCLQERPFLTLAMPPVPLQDHHQAQDQAVPVGPPPQQMHQQVHQHQCVAHRLMQLVTTRTCQHTYPAICTTYVKVIYRYMYCTRCH
jgi:hypothetical protein